MENTIKVSVCIITFNHADYVKRAVDSVLAQEVSFPIEILIADDCSTDNTQEILRTYEGKHPNLQMNLRKVNLWGKPDSCSWLLHKSARGEYIITLEGDDFWLDPHKLQKQADFLDAHEDYIAVAHPCLVVGDDSEPNGETYPDCRDDEYTFDHYASNILPGQTTTIMYRNVYRGTPQADLSIMHKALNPGDRLLNFLLLCNGRVHCMKDWMSAYRHVTTHGSSFSATFKPNFLRDLNWYRELLAYARKNADKRGVVAAQIFLIGYYRSNILGLHSNNRWKAFCCWLREDFYLVSYVKYVEGIINRKLLHKTPCIHL